MTLAARGQEPYATGVRGLAEVARAAGWGFQALEDCGGDRPWQAKRLALRWALERHADRVCWCDADVVVHDPVALAGQLNADQPAGLWVHGKWSVESAFQSQALRNGDTVAAIERVDRARALYRSFCGMYEAGEGVPCWEDWISVFAIPPDVGLRICDVWDHVADRLRVEGLTWTDALSTGLAASACGVPILRVLNGRVVRRSIEHLLHSYRTGRYRELGECLP